MAETNGVRLDRIEEKLDKLSDAIVAIARAEEKIIAMEKRFDFMEVDRTKLYQKVDEMHDDIDCMKGTVDNNAQTVANINKLFWVLLLAIIGSLVGHAFGLPIDFIG